VCARVCTITRVLDIDNGLAFGVYNSCCSLLPPTRFKNRKRSGSINVMVFCDVKAAAALPRSAEREYYHCSARLYAYRRLLPPRPNTPNPYNPFFPTPMMGPTKLGAGTVSMFTKLVPTG